MSQYILKNKVTELRKAKKLTQHELADKVGLTEWTINKIENSPYYELTALTEHLLARALGVDPSELFWLEKSGGSLIMLKKLFLPNGKMRVEYVYLMRFVFTGIIWILYGITNLLETKMPALKILSSILMLVAVANIVLSFAIKHEIPDYYAKKHLSEASMIVLGLLSVIIMITICFIPFSGDMELNLKPILPFVLGFVLFLVGMIWGYLFEVWFFDKDNK